MTTGVGGIGGAGAAVTVSVAAPRDRFAAGAGSVVLADDVLIAAIRLNAAGRLLVTTG